MNAPVKSQPDERWCIYVRGYGTFRFNGTEAEAEIMRQHKMNGSRTVATKWRENLSTELDRLRAKQAELWIDGKGVPISLLKKIRRARAAELGK